MEIKDFIEKAIEGGWNPTEQTASKVEGDTAYFYSEEYPEEGSEACDIYFILLDPLAWKAVERNAILTTEGWEKFTPQHIEKIAANEAQKNMHGLVDALIRGETIEEYLHTL